MRQGEAVQIVPFDGTLPDEIEATGVALQRAEAAPPWLADTGLVLGVGLDPDGTRTGVVDPRASGVALAE